MKETQVRSLGKEDALEKLQPTPVFLPGKSHGQTSLAGYIVHGVAKSGTRLKGLSVQRQEIILPKKKKLNIFLIF